MDENEELESVESAESELSVDYAAKKRRIVILLLAFSAVLGVLSCFLPEEDGLLDLIVGLPFLFLGISWCFTDAAERDHPIGPVVRLLLIFAFVVGLPIYLLHTRGIGAVKSIGFALVLVAAMAACLFVTAFATLYVGDVAGLWALEN